MRKQEKVDYITARFIILNEVLGMELKLPFDADQILADDITECYEWLRNIMTGSYKDYRKIYNLHTKVEWDEIQNHLALFEEEKLLKQKKHILRCEVNNRQSRPYVLRRQYIRDKEKQQRRKEARRKKAKVSKADQSESQSSGKTGES